MLASFAPIYVDALDRLARCAGIRSIVKWGAKEMFGMITFAVGRLVEGTAEVSDVVTDETVFRILYAANEASTFSAPVAFVLQAKNYLSNLVQSVKANTTDYHRIEVSPLLQAGSKGSKGRKTE